MPYGNKRQLAREKHARDTLVNTLAKIHNLEPILGGKWREKMVIYYRRRLAELLLYQSGLAIPSQIAIDAMSKQIAEVLDPNG